MSEIDKWSNAEIRKFLINNGEECGPVTLTTRNVYIDRINKLKYLRRKSTTPKRIIASESRPSTYSLLKNTDICNGSNRESPKTYNRLSRPQFNESLKRDATNYRSYRTSTEVSPKPQLNVDTNSSNRWYQNSLNSLSSFLTTNKANNSCLDLSDADASDYENEDLVSRLRKNYMKTGINGRRPASSAGPPHTISSSSWGLRNLRSLRPENLPNMLMAAFIVSTLILLSIYWVIWSRHGDPGSSEMELSLHRFVCPSGQTLQSPQICIMETSLPRVRTGLSRLYDVLAKHAGDQLCESGGSQRLAFNLAKEKVDQRLRVVGLDTLSDTEWSSMLMLVLRLPTELLGIVCFDNLGDQLDFTSKSEVVTYLESLRPRCPLICRMRLGMLMVLEWLLYAGLVVAALLLMAGFGYGLLVLRRRRIEAREALACEYRDIAASISSLLQDQLRSSQQFPDQEPFMSLVGIRTTIQQSYPKVRNQRFWDDVKTHLYQSEPSIELKERVLHGEVLQWRGRPVWQGSALQAGSEVVFEKGPTECLKIRNMEVKGFCPDKEEYLRQELFQRLMSVGHIRHIGFSFKGDKIIAYVLCADRNISGRAFRQINANYFNGNLLNVKFVRLDKYRSRFPAIEA